MPNPDQESAREAAERYEKEWGEGEGRPICFQDRFLTKQLMEYAIRRDREEREKEIQGELLEVGAIGDGECLNVLIPDLLSSQLAELDKGSCICIMLRKDDVKIFRDGYRIGDGKSLEQAARTAREEKEDEIQR